MHFPLYLNLNYLGNKRGLDCLIGGLSLPPVALLLALYDRKKMKAVFCPLRSISSELGEEVESVS